MTSYTGDLRTLFEIRNVMAGRLEMNYFLLLHGHPPIIIHEEDHKEYYAALGVWDVRQELEPLIRYLREETARTWENR